MRGPPTSPTCRKCGVFVTILRLFPGQLVCTFLLMSEGISGPSGDQDGAGSHDGTKPGDRPDASDSQFDQELQALLSGDALEARFQELSAEERERHARKTQKQQKKAKKERHKTRRRRALRRTAWGLAAVVLAGAGTFAYLRFGHLLSGPGGPNDTQTVKHGALPSMTFASATPPGQSALPPADPFQGTPADKWANGAAGITVPSAEPIGRYSAAQVAAAYQTTKKLLIAAALDNQTLNGGAPTAFADLLTQQQRTYFVSHLNKVGASKHGPLSSRTMVVSFAPGTTKLIGSVIKVHGTMSAHSTTDSHGQPVLEVDLNYRVAYAVQPPKAPSDWMRVVGSFVGPVQFGEWAEANTPFEPWWEFSPGTAGGRCAMKDGFVHPDYPGGPGDTTPRKGHIVNPYDLGDKPGVGCHETTGT